LARVVGTRPGIIMFSPIIRACVRRGLDFFIIHTGQHYSPNMDAMIFKDLELPLPRHHIEGVAEKKMHGAQTAAMLEGVEKVLVEERPSIVLVGGDANTNLAGALAARKLHIMLGHVEAGERSYDWRMPEEHNRRMIDHISDLLFTTNEKSARQLADEKVMGKIFTTGNTIVDAACQNYEIARTKSDILEKNTLKPGGYGILTTHREENVDDLERLAGILEGVERVAKELGVIIFFAAHPRTLIRLKQFNLEERVRSMDGLLLREAPAYLDFLAVLGSARIVLTDSGGVQQEACILRKPCVTLRENTEWVETLEIGANVLAGTDSERIFEAARKMIEKEADWDAPFGDGKTSDRIMDICLETLC
jgi:UDP-N-acetylglucosamine 2-epimerase (non-hydrolysing)